MIFASEFRCLEGFGKGGIAKIDFNSNWFSHDSRLHFSWFWVALGPIFMTFVALETCLKLDDSSRSSWVHPGPGNPAGGRERNDFWP